MLGKLIAGDGAGGLVGDIQGGDKSIVPVSLSKSLHHAFLDAGVTVSRLMISCFDGRESSSSGDIEFGLIESQWPEEVAYGLMTLRRCLGGSGKRGSVVARRCHGELGSSARVRRNSTVVSGDDL